MAAPTPFSGYVHVAGGRLVDGAGAPLLMRGVGLGNWLLAEGYMWRFPNTAPQSGRAIEALIADLVGREAATAFWHDFRERFITEDDIAAIAAEGLDHVRLPLNARLLIDDDGAIIQQGFAYVDRLIDWCRTHGLWIVLDLHGAPGGQTGTNIDDSPRGLPELFVHPHHRENTVRLWREIAGRYAGEKTVAGYDLLNEPLPNEFQHRYAADLVDLYLELTKEIRAVDPDHLLIYEGSHWATNWSMFDRVWDANSMLQFHKYWSPPDRPSIQRFLDVGARLGLPIYMGEGGENNAEWLQTAFELYETCGISWNLWPWKKLDTLTSPVSVRPPDGWDRIVAYASTGEDKPDETAARAILANLLDNMELAVCERRPEVLNACLRRPPLTFGAAGFGFGGEGVSYATAGTAAPLVGFRNDDRVTLCHPGGEPETLNFSHSDGTARSADETFEVELADGDWVAFDFHSASTTSISVTADVTAGAVDLWLDGGRIGSAADTGGRPVGTVGPGRHSVRVQAVGAPAHLRGVHLALQD